MATQSKEVMLNNKSIAEFMGATFQYFDDNEAAVDGLVSYIWAHDSMKTLGCKQWWMCTSDTDDRWAWQFPDGFNWNSDWNELLEVMERISTIKLESTNEQIHRLYNEWFRESLEAFLDVNIDDVYRRIVGFINEYKNIINMVTV